MGGEGEDDRGEGKTLFYGISGGRSINLLCILLLCGGAWPSAAQESEPEHSHPVSVLISVLAEGEAGTDTLERVLVRSMNVEAVRHGLEPLALFREERPGGLEEVAALARSRRQDFLLMAGYRLDGQRITIALRFFDLRDSRLLAEEQAVGRIDLTLDATVSSAMEALVPRVAARVAEVARLKKEEADRQRAQETARLEAGEAARQAAEEAARREEQARIAAAAEQREAEETEPSREPGQGETGPGVALGEAPAPTLPLQRPFTPAPGKGEGLRPLELSLGFAPFVPVGEPGRYFAVGYAPVLGFSYHFALAFGTIGIGAHTGVMYLDPEEQEKVAYFRWLIPLGFDMRYGLPASRPFNLYVQASGGAAYRMPDSLGEQSAVSRRLTKVLPYARGGIGTLFGFGDHFGLSLDATYHAYFYLYRDDGDSGSLALEVLSGVLPSLGMYLRF